MALHLDAGGKRANGWLEDGTPISDQVEWEGTVIRLGVRIVNLVPDSFGNAFLVWQRDDAIPEHILLMKLLPAGPAAPAQSSSRVPTLRGARPMTATSDQVGIRVLSTGPAPRVALSLPNPAPARLDLLDVTGRLTWSQEVDSPGAREHTVQLGAGSLPSGVYLVRLSQAGRAWTARVVIVR